MNIRRLTCLFVSHLWDLSTYDSATGQTTLICMRCHLQYSTSIRL